MTVKLSVSTNDRTDGFWWQTYDYRYPYYEYNNFLYLEYGATAKGIKGLEYDLNNSYFNTISCPYLSSGGLTIASFYGTWAESSVGPISYTGTIYVLAMKASSGRIIVAETGYVDAVIGGVTYPFLHGYPWVYSGSFGTVGTVQPDTTYLISLYLQGNGSYSWY